MTGISDEPTRPPLVTKTTRGRFAPTKTTIGMPTIEGFDQSRWPAVTAVSKMTSRYNLLPAFTISCHRLPVSQQLCPTFCSNWLWQRVNCRRCLRRCRCRGHCHYYDFHCSIYQHCYCHGPTWNRERVERGKNGYSWSYLHNVVMNIHERNLQKAFSISISLSTAILSSFFLTENEMLE